MTVGAEGRTYSTVVTRPSHETMSHQPQFDASEDLPSTSPQDEHCPPFAGGGEGGRKCPDITRLSSLVPYVQLTHVRSACSQPPFAPQLPMSCPGPLHNSTILALVLKISASGPKTPVGPFSSWPQSHVFSSRHCSPSHLTPSQFHDFLTPFFPSRKPCPFSQPLQILYCSSRPKAKPSSP